MCSSFGTMFSLLILVLSANAVFGCTIVSYLPGYDGELPFTLETGYIGVGDMEELQLFYYFIESERDPVRDPLILWLTGGPGCSGFSGLVYEIGPIRFDYDTFNGSLPSLRINHFSWTKTANVLFLDAPVGTGFSYSETQDGYYTSATQSADVIYQCLRKWIEKHPYFANNPLYIAGDSYSGIIVPIVTVAIAADNEARQKPYLNLQGYIVGNPTTDLHNDVNSRVDYFYPVGLISTKLYADAKKYCAGEYILPNASNAKCMNVIERIAEHITKACDAQILREPKYSFDTPRSKSLKWGHNYFQDNPIDISLVKEFPGLDFLCRNENYTLSNIWANDVEVQKVLHVQDNTIRDWKRCHRKLPYDGNILNTVSYHKRLIDSGYRALVYSGDRDLVTPYTATLTWIHSLNFTIIDDWRPWFVEGEVAGFTMKFANVSKSKDGLLFNTVKGAGHTAPDDKPKECFTMIDRWLSYSPM